MSLSTYGGDSVETDAPRYGEQANVEHHPQVTDFVPRRKRAVLLTLACGGAAAAGCQALAHFSESIAAAAPGVDAAFLRERIADGGVAWISAVWLLTAALLARLIYSLRRHRVDDYQGRYRIWRWVGWVAVLASANAVIGFHALVAQMMTAMTGWSLTSSGAEWWLAPLAIVGAWMVFRLGLEVAESRTSLAMMLLAILCYGAAGAGALGWTPPAWGVSADVWTRAVPLVGHTMMLAGLLVFGRYVVLDVQGLIDHSHRGRQTVPAQPQPVRDEVAAAGQAPPAVAAASAAVVARATISDPDHEVDDEDEDHNVHKLSKADKRRLRKQNRAA